MLKKGDNKTKYNPDLASGINYDYYKEIAGLENKNYDNEEQLLEGQIERQETSEKINTLQDKDKNKKD